MTRTWYVNDSGHSQPRAVALFDLSPSTKRIVNESAGGMLEYINQHEYFNASILFKRLDENGTHYLYSLLAWANQGEQFRFSLDQRFDGSTGIGLLTQDAAPGDTILHTDNSWSGYPPTFEIIIFNHLGHYDKCWVTRATSNQLMLINGAPSYSELTYYYTAGMAIVKYAYYFHKAEAVNPVSNITLKPGVARYDFPFRFRELMDVGMLS